MTHLSGLGCCDINVTQYTRALPGLSPSVHAYSLAQCARDKAQRGPKSREEEDVPDVLLSVKLLPDPCTQTRSVVPTAILGPLLCQALRRILSTASSGLLLSVFVWHRCLYVTLPHWTASFLRAETVCVLCTFLYPGVTPFPAVWPWTGCLTWWAYFLICEMGQGCLPLAHIMGRRSVVSDMAALCRRPARDSQKTLRGLNSLTFQVHDEIRGCVCELGHWA